MDSESDLQRRFSELKSGLIDEDEEYRYKVAREIARLGRSIPPEVIELARDSVPRLREMACYMLGQIGAPPEPWNDLYSEGVPILLDLLKNDPDDEVRASAAAALGFHTEPSTLPALLEASEDESTEVRFEVTRALGRFFETTWEDKPAAAQYREPVIDALLRLMDDEEDDVRDWATFAMHQGGHDTFAVRQRLWAALEDPNCDVRGEASFALAKLSETDLIPHLIQLLDEDEVSPCYFEAAAELRDPVLLPAVKKASAKWREIIGKDDSLHSIMNFSIETLSRADDPSEARIAK